MDILRQKLIEYIPELQEIDTSEFTTSTLLVYASAIRPVTMQRVIYDSILHIDNKTEDYGFNPLVALPLLNKARNIIGKALKTGAKIIKNVAKKHEIKIVPKETPVIIQPPITAGANVEAGKEEKDKNKNKNLILYAGIGLVVLIIFIMIMKK